MRTRASGPDNYLSAAVAQDDDGEINAGSTKPIMGNYSFLDNSMFWHIGAWSDGLFWLENAQNGSSWHLNHTGNGYFRMSSNITAPQTGQRFKFTALEDISNDNYSTYSVSVWESYHLPPHILIFSGSRYSSSSNGHSFLVSDRHRKYVNHL